MKTIGLKRGLAAVLILMLAMSVPARAGIFDWLSGNPEASGDSSVTLPPAEALYTPGTSLPTATPSVTPAPVEEVSTRENSVIRVELRSLELPRELHLRLSGVYAVDADPGFRFDRDTGITLLASDGSIFLYAGGLTLDMGPSVTFTRHLAESGVENGIRIEETGRENLYCGDLTVTLQGEGLRCVLKISVEDYLCGVVAYEMSDAFPLEALKAQAVAARTYALRRRAQAGKKDYDLVDTTADQVFRGFDPRFENVSRAVEETRGIVERFEGGYAMCWYTASNGGQTALPSQIWAMEGADGYLDVRDDPYDLENPKSLEKALTVPPDCAGCDALRTMLEEALSGPMAEEGFGPEEWALDGIVSIQPVNPRFEGTRLYDGLKFALRVRLLMPVTTPAPTASPTPSAGPPAAEDDRADAADRPAPTPAGTPDAADMPVVSDEPMSGEEIPREWVVSDAPREVTLDVFRQIKPGLDLGINGTDCELIDVKSELDEAGAPVAFTLIMRRFGHGVGMSQRGAQRMAGHWGMHWQQILSFYYPGLTPARMLWEDEPLSDLGTLPAGGGAARPRPTPTPSPAPLPPLEAGQHYARVTATTLNLRQSPTTASPAIDQLPGGRQVIVASAPDADGWVEVITSDARGYVKAEYLQDE